MHQIIRAFKVRPDAPFAFAVVTCLIPELDPDPKKPFMPVLRIVLHKGCGAVVNRGTMRTVRAALGKSLGLVFVDRKPIDRISRRLGETMGIKGTRSCVVPGNERLPGAPVLQTHNSEPAVIISALRLLSPRDPDVEVALQERLYFPQAA